MLCHHLSVCTCPFNVQLANGMCQCMYDKGTTAFHVTCTLQCPVCTIQSYCMLCRVFMYKWTVNWRMLPEHVFLHKHLAQGLLAAHCLLLIVFMQRRWLRDQGGFLAVVQRFSSSHAWRQWQSRQRLAPDVTLTVVLASNYIGIVCARSLHYQFYAWYFHAVPYLLWRTRLHTAARLCILVAIEACWNVFPSTPLSSSVLLGCHLILLAALWLGPAGRA